MTEAHRYNKLLEVLQDKKILSNQEICDLLEISPATTRRYINKLADAGKILKIRNGAQVIKASRPVSQKVINNLEQKTRIAEKASQLCKDGDSLLLTCGSTMMILADRLCGKKVQIVTNFLPLANYLIEHDHEDVVITGGQYHKNKAVTLTLDSQLKVPYATNIVFTSGKGLTTEGLFKTDMIIASAEQHLINNVEKLVVLLDSSKLDKRVGFIFAHLARIDLLITGAEADPKIIKQLRSQGLNIILA